MTSENEELDENTGKTEGELNFEAVLDKLRETVETLQHGGLTLNEATRLFDEGMKLAKTCNQLLADADLKINRLQRDFTRDMEQLGESRIAKERNGQDKGQ
jgi:exodeoxyribonuclease VII small subunit